MKLKRIISAALAGIMIAGSMLVGSVSAAEDELPFKDVKKKKWFYNAVKYVYDEGIMDGTSKKYFEPDGGLTRAMFITILGRMAGAEQKETSAFPDIKKKSWYSGYVGWALETGVVTGYPDGTFMPDKELSREEMAVAVDRYIDYLGVRMTSEGGMWKFNDQKKVGKWAVDSLAVLRNSGVIEGDQNGNFNPKNSITRAEAATIVMKLKAAMENAWQGYLPTDDGVESVVLGASYLYWNGSAFAGGMAQELDSDGALPVLETTMSRYDYSKTYHKANTAGVSINYNEIDVTKYPFVKIAYKYNGMEGELSAVYSVNVTESETAGFVEELALKAGADDAGMKTATIDLTAVNASHTVNYSAELANLLFKPCEDSFDVEGSFDILYIGFFKTQAAADAFTSSSDADIADYLENYEHYTTLDWRELTDEDEANYDKLLADRIAEIKNSKSAVTAADITKAGGKCYFISSINGNDKNDGLSEKTAWKTFDNLYKTKAGGLVVEYLPKEGDGVFFERGSEFYAETYLNSSMRGFNGAGNLEGSLGEGVTYGAYGEGEKPLFTAAMDFRDSGNTGNWVATEYPNVWRLDDEQVKPDWETGKIEVGNMIFNDGEGIGVRIMPQSEDKCFGEGETSTNRAWRCNGYEYFYTGVSDLTNPGTALKHNLEYIHDQEKQEIYLYWDKGNPSDYFDDIKVSRNAYIFNSGDNCRVDNLKIAYGTDYALHPGANGTTVTNCEIGFVGGSRSSIESGSEIYGSTNGSYFYDCYIHDVGDGAITSQSGGGSADDPDQIQNIEYIGNVMVACGHSAEIWNSVSNLDENGYSINKIKNVLIKDNLMAYNGYGFHQTQAGGANSAGETICGSMYGEFENCRIEGNVFYKGYGNLYTAYMATYEQPRGWMAKGNTYVANTYYYNIGYCYETLNHIDHHMWKRARVSFSYSYEGLAWYTSLGIDPMGTYYYYSDNSNEYEEYGCFFMSGYYAEHGGFEIK